MRFVLQSWNVSFYLIIADAFDYLDAPVVRITGADIPMPYAANLEALSLPTVDGIVETVKKVCVGMGKKI